MSTAPPTWLTRDAIACHPKRKLIFQPLRLRRDSASETLVVHYAPESALPVSECRLAQVSDLLSRETAVYMQGKRYSKTVNGLLVTLGQGPCLYHIHLARDDCAIANFAAAFNGKIISLDGDQTAWIDQLFTPEKTPEKTHVPETL